MFLICLLVLNLSEQFWIVYILKDEQWHWIINRHEWKRGLGCWSADSVNFNNGLFIHIVCTHLGDGGSEDNDCGVIWIENKDLLL